VRRLFRDDALQTTFERDGYVVVPVLGEAAVARFAALWADVRPAEVDGIYSNVQDPQPVVSRRVHDAVVEAFAPRVAEIFVDARIAGATFLVKGTEPDSHCTVHQDYDNVDERLGTSFSVWCPLEDVDEDNGALVVLPGTHRLFDVARVVTMPSLRLDLEDVEDLATLVPVPAGHGVVYAHSLFHGSVPNHTDHERVAVTCGVIPAELDHLHYWPDPDREGQLRRVGIDAEFYYGGLSELWAGHRPDGLPDLGPADVDPGPLSREQVLAAVLAERAPTAGPRRP
jgi:hypothetical protein